MKVGKKPTNAYPPGNVSLERALSKLGFASRTQARVLIEAGRVRVGERVVKNSKLGVNPEKARISIDGETAAAEPFTAYLLHKPKGVVTTRSDEKGRKTVFSFIQDARAHLHSVGRLDLATSGLLILTNDTQLSNWLTDPETGIPRTYTVTVRGEVDEAILARLRKGVKDGDDFLKPTKIELKKGSRRESHLVVTLCEGKNREIRRLFLAVEREVSALKRVSYGALELGTLQPGEIRPLTQQEIKAAFPGAAFKLK